MLAEYCFNAVIQIAHNTNPLTAISDAVSFKAWTWAAAQLNPAAYGDRVALQHSGGVTTTHRQITSEMTLEEASQAYSDFVKRPLTALPGPEVVDAEYKDVTPVRKDAA